MARHPVRSRASRPPRAEPIALRAGPLEWLLDPAGGAVRRVRLRGREVLRGIYAAVRDHNWDTVAPALRFVSRRVERDRCLLEFECEHRRGGLRFRWRGRLEGRPDGTLIYGFDGEALSAFRKNRIGFCVLHPILECAGRRAWQRRTDGSVRRARFPAAIEPQIFGRSSFRDLRGITHEVAPGCRARVDFEGDVFEMEDQRNWTDASFKTYCTPLLEPFPVTIAAGQRISQKVTLRLIRKPGTRLPAPRRRTGAIPLVTIPDKPTGMLPRLGLGLASHGGPLDDEELSRLRRLRLAHLRVDLALGTAGAGPTLVRALREAAELRIPLELAVHLPARGQCDPGRLPALLEKAGWPVARVLALRTGEAATGRETLAWVRRHFGGRGRPLGAGSDGNFRELNYAHALGRLGSARADFLFWSINPQVHAFDDGSVMQTLEAQPDTVRTARTMAEHLPLVVSPLTLRQRFNPVATGAAARTPGGLPAAVDPRQRENFAAAWLLGSIAALAAEGVESVTCFETSGWRGVMERAGGSPLPDRFPSRPGELFPVYRVLSALAGGRAVAALPPSGGNALAALALFAAGRQPEVLIANLSPATRRVRVRRRRRTALLELPPYGVSRWPKPARPR
jgi:D-apionolactonase